MSGVIEFDDDDVAAFTVVGGYMQPQGHVQVISNLVDYGMDLQPALDAPRWRYREDRTLAVEERTPMEIDSKLVRRGHDVRIEIPAAFGGAQIARVTDGTFREPVNLGRMKHRSETEYDGDGTSRRRWNQVIRPYVTSMDRKEVSTGTKWEAEFGYSRAVRVGDTIRVAGTTAVQDGEPVAPGDPYEQTRYALETIGDALHELGAGPDDVLSTTIYVVDFDDWEPIGEAHREFFGEIRPATTLLQVATLPDPAFRVEIEATAAVPE